MKHLLSYLVLFCFASLSTTAQKVISIKVDGAITPATADYIQRSLNDASSQQAECIIIRLNAPGGLLKSTRLIVSNILVSPVPVIVYVSPAGANAGSAGVFLTLAAHVAVMAPGTNIGAAHPVSSSGQLDTVMNTKVTNDAVAFIRTIAEKRNRNVEWAAQAVLNSVSITENEALKLKVVDFIAANERDLLQLVNGRKIQLEEATKVLQTENATIHTVDMAWYEKLLQIISDPNIAYILFLLGLYGLLFEVYSPGALFPGIIGGISLILALYAMHTLPINYAGMALIIFAIILFVLEIKITSHGMLTIGGVISLLLGSMMLIRTDEVWNVTGISLGIIIPAVVITALFFLVIVAMGIRAQRLETTTGVEGMIGLIGESITPLDPAGKVLVHGEIWNAHSVSGEFIGEGKKVRIKSLKDFTVLVEIIQI